MKIETTKRGFSLLTHPTHATEPENTRLVRESSAIGYYPDAEQRPGTSALWIGDHHHLNRNEVALLVVHLVRWLDTGRLAKQPAEMINAET